MGGINEKDGSQTSSSLVQTRLQLFFLKSACASTSASAGICPTFRYSMPMFFEKHTHTTFTALNTGEFVDFCRCFFNSSCWICPKIVFN